MKYVPTRVIWAIAAQGLVGVLLFIMGVLRNSTLDYWYLPYNLVLAAIPFFLAMGVVRLLQKHSWRDWRVTALLLLWLLFLPNSFYIVTYFIHLFDAHRVDVVQDIFMLMQFSLLGMILGFSSLFMLHKIYLQKIGQKATVLAGVVLFLCSFAIYLGRELRWNSWDIIVNPLGLIADAFRIVTHPFAHTDALFMMLSFLGMLGSLYGVVWTVFKGHKLTSSDKDVIIRS